MRSFTVVHVLLLLLFLLAYQCTHAQDYVITVKGDSLVGDTRLFNYGKEWKVQLTRADKTKSIFSVFETREFSDNGNIYHPVKFADAYVFMKLLKEGYLSLYAFQHPGQITFDGRYLLRKDAKGLEVPNLTFKRAIEGFLSDCETVSVNMSEGKYNRKKLDLIVDDYNACIAAKTNSVQRSTSVVATPQANSVPQSWKTLNAKLKEHGDFEGKADALEIISDITGKLSRGEKVPNFLITGLKSSLDSASLQTELDAALKDLAQ